MIIHSFGVALMSFIFDSRFNAMSARKLWRAMVFPGQTDLVVARELELMTDEHQINRARINYLFTSSSSLRSSFVVSIAHLNSVYQKVHVQIIKHTQRLMDLNGRCVVSGINRKS